MIYLETPLTVDKIKQLKAGDEVFLSGNDLYRKRCCS